MVARLVLAGLALSLTVGCGAQPPAAEDDAEPIGSRSEAIAGGYDAGGDAAVVGVAITDDAGYVTRTCTGTLLAPNLVLTAQHCVAQTADLVTCETSSFGAAVPADHVFATTHPSMWDEDAPWHEGAAIHVPPGTGVCGRDVALVVLGEAIEDVPLLVPRLDGDAAPGETYSAVGYGNTAAGYQDGGQRRRRDGLTVVCIGAECDDDGHVDEREWRGDHGICNGDSGGPALDGSGRIAGVTSRGPEGCDLPIYGGLRPWTRWLGDTAAIAAAEGDYEAPEWVKSAQLAAPYDDSDSEALLDCAVAAPGAPAAGWAGVAAAAALAVAGVGRARRARTRRGVARSSA